MDVSRLAENADDAAALLALLANGKRLTIIEHLLDREMSVGAIAKEVSLSQSALSQHLAKMRDDNVVTFRRDSQTLWYRIADPRIEQLMAELHRLFCRVTPAT